MNASDRFWTLDPLPVPPAVPKDSAAWWRWVSKLTLEARKEPS